MKTSLSVIIGWMLCITIQAQNVPDIRNIKYGSVIPDEGYCDQPYLVKNEDGSWTCVMTTGTGHEGDHGQHIVATITDDRGQTWTELIDIEPADGPAASWGMPFKTPYGRIYVFYTYNIDRVKEIPDAPPFYSGRVDTHGAYAMKYSDDNGKTWSERYEIPVREMEIDRKNNFDGAYRQFWGVGKPIVTDGKMYFGFAKVGKWGFPGTMITSEGAFMMSDNILTEKDPEKLNWVTLPEGDHGLRAPKGPVADEANLVALNDGSLYCTYRTIDGYNCHAYSRDGGKTWTGPEYATYSPDGRRINHSRAYNPVKKFSNGKYLLWFHNHGGASVHNNADWQYYQGRNPVWIAGGVEKDGHIYWSQPEILLYDSDPSVRISYPDFIEVDGEYYATETQKTIARIHKIDKSILEAAWSQAENNRIAREGLIAEASEEQIAKGEVISIPQLPKLKEGNGLALDFWINLEHLHAGQVILDAMDEDSKGFKVTTGPNWNLTFTMSNGIKTVSWDSDPGTHPGTMKANKLQHVGINVDAGAGVISYVINGQINDGGDVREYGWGRIPFDLIDINGDNELRVAPHLYHDGYVKNVRIYDRYLLTSEMVGNFQAGIK